MTNNENKKDIRIRSNVYDSMVKSPNRAMLRATGMGDEEFNQPLIGVISTWAENTPCNIHLHDLGKVAKQGIRHDYRSRRYCDGNPRNALLASIT